MVVKVFSKQDQLPGPFSAAIHNFSSLHVPTVTKLRLCVLIIGLAIVRGGEVMLLLFNSFPAC